MSRLISHLTLPSPKCSHQKATTDARTKQRPLWHCSWSSRAYLCLRRRAFWEGGSVFRYNQRQGLRQHQTLVRKRNVCLHGLRQHHILIRTVVGGGHHGLSQHQTLVREEGVFLHGISHDLRQHQASHRYCCDRALSMIFKYPFWCCRPHSPEPIICAEPRPAAPAAAAAARARRWNRGSVPRSSAWPLGALLRGKQKEHHRDVLGTGEAGSATNSKVTKNAPHPAAR